MMVSGKRMYSVVEENSLTQMKITSKENGRMVRPKDLEYTIIEMELYMRGTG